MKEIKIDELKSIEMSVLIKFADFCNKNNLYYTLGYGTLLGAIRHKGFIPWDDDIDVIMPRPDYEKFIELAKHKKISSNTEVISYKLGNSTYPFTKIIDNRTEVEEKFAKKTKIGVWIDVFALDGNFKNDFLNKFHYKVARLMRKVIEIKRNDFGSGATKKRQVIKIIIYPFINIFSCKFLCKIMDKICMIKKYENSDYIGCVVWGRSNKDRTTKEAFMKKINVEFERYLFNAPSNYDEYLRNIYGNYMQIPPESERETHSFKAWWKD